MNQEIRNKLRNVVTQCRKLLEDSISQELEGKYGIFAKKDQVTADPNAKMTHLTEEEQAARKDILDHFGHIKARGFKPKEAFDQLVREIAFTHLNRLCAYKMIEAREVYVGGQKVREAVSRGINSNGVKFYLADHPDEERMFNTGHQDVAYRHFLDWLGGLLSDEIGVLFNPNDPANRLYPRQKTLDEVLDLLNGGGIKAEEAELREEWPRMWSQDETIGWVYQYFTPNELRDQARKESQSPRNSYELAFRNQFFTPRYVVEFLTDNTLGRIWYEMQKGNTTLKDSCRYMVSRPSEMFLSEGVQSPKDSAEGRDDLSQEELLKLPVRIPHRPKKDPRELRILDPACGSGHFLLYCFDLLLTIYEEAYFDPDLGPALHKDYPTLEDLRRDAPRLILSHNLHGIDIDERASQIAALALWLRCQRAYKDMGLKKDRPKITRSNIVCAEPMPGEEQMLKEFVGQLEPRLLGQLVEVVFDKMALAGEAGSLLKIDEELRGAVSEAKRQWLAGPISIQRNLFGDDKPVAQQQRFDFSGISDAKFFEQAEAKVVDALRSYAEKAHNGQRLQRQLFTEDTVRGFAFVDLCHHRFDVVLMNPPFGEFSVGATAYYGRAYAHAGNNLAGLFLCRSLSILTPNGTFGFIGPRALLFLPSTEGARIEALITTGKLRFAADLGLRVMDDAWIEACAAICDASPSCPPSVFIRLVDTLDKQQGLVEAITTHNHCDTHGRVRLASIQPFLEYPNSAISYWLPPSYLRLFQKRQTFDRNYGTIRQGLGTAEDFRYLRLLAELPSTSVNAMFVPLAKGGEYSPFYGVPDLFVFWVDEGKCYWDDKSTNTGRPRSNIWMLKDTISKYFMRKGLTYTQRTNSAFAPRILPDGCLFGQKGESIFCDSADDLLFVLGMMHSKPFQVLVEAFVAASDSVQSGGAARSYFSGTIKKLPLPKVPVDDPRHRTISMATAAIVEMWMRRGTTDPLSQLFILPWKIGDPIKGMTLRGIAEAELREEHLSDAECLRQSWIIESTAREVFELTEVDIEFIHDSLGPHVEEYPEKQVESEYLILDALSEDQMLSWLREHGYTGRQFVNQCYHSSRKVEIISHLSKCRGSMVAGQLGSLALESGHRVGELASGVLDWAVGCAVGRWDVSLGDGQRTRPQLPDPFALLPNRPLGSLADDQLPGHSGDHCLKVVQDGIFVDDSEHDSDIARHVREVLEVVWGECADGIENEACDLLDVKELRAYFRRPGKGGFWDDHVARYSKSRRKAPVYWLLQSSKKNYALWIYYHRLDKDMLFKALVNYVEPKIRLETSRLDTLRRQKSAAGDSGKEAKRLAKEVERQEDFLSELRDFDDKLRRAANRHLEPDLNDGVVLNIAPLWELVPWKEAKNYWDELLQGKYEWSSIGKQLRQKGLVK
jgi:hypothetical protein